MTQKKLFLPASILLAGLITIAVLVAARPKPEAKPADAEPAHIKVAVTQARSQVLRLPVSAYGTVAPKREIDLVAQVSGQLVGVEPAFVNGGFFDPSQRLVQIDDRDYQAALLNARAQLAEAQRLLAEEEGRSHQAKREWRDLGNQNANDLFLRKPQLAAARAQLAAARGAVDTAELNLERTTIQAPFAGRIKQTYANLGQYVTAGTRIATIYDSTVAEIRVPLTEKQATLIDLPLSRLLQNGVEADKPMPRVIVKGSVAGTKHQWEGVLTRTDAFVDADSRMYYAVIEVSNPFAEVPLLPGLFVEAEISGREMADVLVLPRSALFELDKILTVDEQKTISHQTVNVLHKSDSQVWVQANLAEGTLVSVEKQSLTPAGTIINPVQTMDGNSELAATESPVKE